MHSRALRSAFIHYFQSHGHLLVPSSPVVPVADPTLLFVNAGMNQFKEVFLGNEKRDYQRAVTIQKCIRAGGKHNDLTHVGFTARHLTFFEMMGNFSFGDYFKREAIRYAWECVTTALNIPAEKCWVTVYKDDEEAFNIWHKDIGLPVERIGKLGEKDNFWQMGDTGPCGPCSEIYIDRGIVHDYDRDARPGDDFSSRFTEIWNLVFMEFNRNANGELERLEHVGVDTGMGLERLAMISQGVQSVFETDLFTGILAYAKTRFKPRDKKDEFVKSALCVLADHIRTCSMVIAENVLPSNEGRGYVIRKIIRRALLFAYKLGDVYGFADLVEPCLESFAGIYPDCIGHTLSIKETIKEETKKFIHNLEQGEKRFLLSLSRDTRSANFSGKEAFILYDTYGFPLELTQVMAHEHNLQVDIQEFEKCMEEQRGRSRAEGTFKGDALVGIGEYRTEFIGYDAYECPSFIQAIFVEGKRVDTLLPSVEGVLIVDKTCFYAQGGGQVSDKGVLLLNEDKYFPEKIVKQGEARGFVVRAQNVIKAGQCVHQVIDKEARLAASRNHTAAHLLQAALRHFYGASVAQAGSFVSPEYMRFDATLSVSLSMQDLRALEYYINAIILANIPITTEDTTYEKAIERGALALFTEKYDRSSVRVVHVGDISHELCGGTHVERTGDLGSFKIVESTLPSAGTRRFVVLTGYGALERYADWQETITYLTSTYKCSEDKIVLALEKQNELVKSGNKKYEILLEKYADVLVEQWKSKVHTIGNLHSGFYEVSQDLVPLLAKIMRAFQNSKPGMYGFISDAKEKKVLALSLSPALLQSLSLAFVEQMLISYGFSGKVTEKHIQGVVMSSFSVKQGEELLMKMREKIHL